MSRLPIPGQDSGTWGDILNDYLSQVHNADGTLKAGSVGVTQLQNGTNGVFPAGNFASLQAAIDAAAAAGGGVVQLPAGPTTVSATVQMKSRVVLAGPPMETGVWGYAPDPTLYHAAWLVADNSTTGPVVQFNNIYEAGIRDLLIKSVSTRNGVEFQSTTVDRGGNRLRNVYVNGANVGILSNQKEVRLRDIVVMNCASDGVQINQQDCEWEGGIVGYNGGNGVVLGTSSGPIRASTLDTFYNTGHGIVIDGFGHRWDGLIANSNKKTGVFFRSATATTIGKIWASDNGTEYNGTTNLTRYSDVLFGHPTAGNAGCSIIGGLIYNGTAAPTKYAVESTEAIPSIPTLIGIHFSGTYSTGNTPYQQIYTLSNFNIVGCNNMPTMVREQAGVPTMFADGSGNGSVDLLQFTSGGGIARSRVRGGGAFQGAVQSVNASAGSPSLDMRFANTWNITLDANVTASSVTNQIAGQQLTINFIQDGTGGRTYTWPSECKFAGNAAPTATTTANYRDSVTFVSDGTYLREVARAVESITPDTAATPSTLAKRDSNGTILANSFLPSSQVTATSGGTTVLTASSKQVQIFTGTLAHACNLPTSVPAGTSFTIIHQSVTGFMTINASNGDLVAYAISVATVTVMANVANPVTAADWTVTSYPASMGTVIGTAVIRDYAGMASFANAAAGATTTATSGGTLTLAYGSNVNRTQIFTGSANHTLVLPSGSITAGIEFIVINQSTGSITVNASGGGTVTTVAASGTARVIAIVATPTTAANWKVVG